MAAMSLAQLQHDYVHELREPATVKNGKHVSHCHYFVLGATTLILPQTIPYVLSKAAKIMEFDIPKDADAQELERMLQKRVEDFWSDMKKKGKNL